MKYTTQLLAAIVLGTALLSCDKAQTTDTASAVQEPKRKLHEAAFFGDLESVQQHIDFGTDLNQKDDYGSTPLNVAITFNHPEVAKSLVQGGADLTVTTADGSTPLHAAALFGRVETVRLLLAQGIALDTRNSYGSTALETVSAPFEQMKPIYDQISRDLGPFGFKLDYRQLQENRIMIAQMLEEASNTTSK